MWTGYLFRLRPAFFVWLIGAGALLVSIARAVAPVSVELQIADLQREGIQASGIRALLQHRGAQMDVSLHVDRLSVPGLDAPLTDIEFSCPDSDRPWPELHCEQGVLRLAESPLGPQQLHVVLDWHPSGEWRMAFSGLRYAGDQLTGELSGTDAGWRLTARASRIALGRAAELQRLRKTWGLEQMSGRLAATLELRGDGDGLHDLSATARVTDLAYADSAGEQAAEKVAGRLSVSARRKGDDWSGSTDVRLQGGEVYSDPLFLDIASQPLRLQASGRWNGRLLSLDRLDLDGGRMLQVKGKGTLDSRALALRKGQLQVDSADLGGLYRQVLQPVLAGTPLDDVEIEGAAACRLQWDGGGLSAIDGSIDRIDLDQRGGRFGFNGLSAQLAWRGQGSSPDSTLALEGGHLGKLEFGGLHLLINAAGRSAWLREPAVVPFYQGTITLGDFSWVQTAQGPDVGFSAAIADVALDELSVALGWPRLQGSVASEIPRARYLGGSLAVDGDLLVDALGGRLTLRRLGLDELGSAAPVLHADMQLRRLDLARLTQAFSFGEIQGRLDGDVEGMRLVGWQSDRFDARFYSSPDDDLPHRISQRAVEDLTELGNGVSGALSASFLRFFEEFSYDRIELKVRQQGDNAWIDGIPAPDGGYYLVKGAGIPRIDVIGRNREVGWKDLLARLKSIRFDGVKMQ